MCGRIPPNLHEIIKVTGEITDVKPKLQVDVFDKRAVWKARAVEEFALGLLCRELDSLPSGRRYRLQRAHQTVQGTLLSKVISLSSVLCCLSDNSQDILLRV